MKTQKLFVSLGPTGEEALAIFLGMLDTLSLRQASGVADFQQLLVRSPGDRGVSTALEKVLTRMESRQGGTVLWRPLPELPWIGAFDKPADNDRPHGFDRAGLSQKCWQEWVQRTVHDQSVPWYAEIGEAIASLQASATRLQLDRHQPVPVFVIANLTDPVESALAYALGRYLSGWQLAEMQPVLMAMLAPREDVSQVAAMARAQGVAALADILRDWQYLGYTNVSVIDGRLTRNGSGIVKLTDYEVATVLGQILYVASASGSGRAALFGNARGPSGHNGSLMTVAAAAYSYDPRLFAHYAAVRLVLCAIEPPNQTDAALEDKLRQTEWPLSAELNGPQGDDPAMPARELSNHLEDLVTADIASIVKTLDDIVARAGYRELLREEFCSRKAVSEWPEVVRDLIAVVEQGVVEPVEPVLQSAARTQTQQLTEALLAKIKGAFQQRELDDRLLGGTAVLGALRLLERRLPELWRAITDRLQAAEQEEAAGAADHDREIARLYETLVREAHLPPHSMAISVRAALYGVLVAAVFLLQNTSWLAMPLPRLGEAAVWGSVTAAVLWALCFAWFVALRRWSCASLVKNIRRHLEMRCGVLLNRMRLNALETYLRDVRLRLAQAVRSDDVAGDPRTLPARGAEGENSLSTRHPLADIQPVLGRYAEAWRQQRSDLQEEAARLALQYQQSAYLNRVPKIPGPNETSWQSDFQADLDRAVATILQLPPDVRVGHDERLAAVVQCLRNAEHGLWQDLMPADFRALPAAMPGYFVRLVNRVQESLYAGYYDHRSINDLLRDMPVGQMRWSAASQDAQSEAKLESLQDSIREDAKRRLLVDALFSHAVLPLPLAGIQAKYFWLSGSASESDDYLLQDQGAKRQVRNGNCDFTNDQATMILLAYRRAIRPSDLLEASGSVYRQLLERARRERPNQPELASVPESFAGGGET